MTWAFLTRTQGKGRLTWVDWITYIYLMFGFVLILVPVLWIVLNSFKTQFQLERQDLSLLPSEFAQVGRATVYGPEGRQMFIADELPAWVLNWRSLDETEKASHDIPAFLATLEGPVFYAARSALGQVDGLARALIAEKGLPEWVVRYPALSGTAKEAFDVQSVMSQLNTEEQRLLGEFLLLAPFEPNKLVAQVLVRAQDPETGQMVGFAVPRFDTSRDVMPARYVDNRTDKVVRIQTATATAERSFKPAFSNYIEPLTGRAQEVTVNFARCFTNSFLVTILATLITLIINSMAAFALSKYRFRGQGFFFFFILATLMVPPTITLVGVFKAINAAGLSGSIWGVIIPGAATPAGVFFVAPIYADHPG